MTSYICFFILVVCKRCKVNLVAFSKRESDFDNDGDNFDDGNKGDDDDDGESED